MSGLLALLLGLAGVLYAVWPWARGRALPAAAEERALRAGEDMHSNVRALRDWAVAAGELRAEDSDAAEGTPFAEVRDE